MKPVLGPLLMFADADREAQFQLIYAQKQIYFDRIGFYACILQLAPGKMQQDNHKLLLCIFVRPA
jgi:hypothetical protein